MHGGNPPDPPSLLAFVSDELDPSSVETSVDSPEELGSEVVGPA
jgi:hypothetical protein